MYHLSIMSSLFITRKQRFYLKCQINVSSIVSVHKFIAVDKILIKNKLFEWIHYTYFHNSYQHTAVYSIDLFVPEYLTPKKSHIAEMIGHFTFLIQLCIDLPRVANMRCFCKTFKRKFKVPLNAFLWDFSLVYFISQSTFPCTNVDVHKPLHQHFRPSMYTKFPSVS